MILLIEPSRSVMNVFSTPTNILSAVEESVLTSWKIAAKGDAITVNKRDRMTF